MTAFAIKKKKERNSILHLWEGSEYVSEYMSEGSEYAQSNFHRFSNKILVLNMTGLRIWQDCENARVTQCAEYAWIYLNNV